MKKTYTIKNLNCASCAIELEDELKKVESIKSAKVNFATGKIVLEHNSSEQEALAAAQSVAKNYDNAKIVAHIDDCASGHCHSGSGVRADILRQAVAFVLFLAALLFVKNLKVQIIIYLVSYFVSAQEVLFNAAKNIVRGKVFDENFLMSIASIGAIVIGRFEEAIEVMVFYGIGEIFQSIAVERTRHSINKLMDMQVPFARKIVGGIEQEVAPELVNIGDYLLIKPGEKVPLDGVVIKGASAFDMRALTGETLPYEIGEGQEVMAGSININGVVTVKAIREFKNSATEKIRQLVEESASRKASQESFITKFAKVYTPIVCFLAVIVAFVVPLFDSFNFIPWIYRALVFLVVSCPCALVISVPLSFFSAIGVSAKSGILIKGGNYLENLAKADIAVFDKTGTLTDGKFEVSKVIAAPNYPNFIKYCAAVQKNSNHPLSKAIAGAFKTNFKAENVEEIAGYGVRGMVEGKTVLCGSQKLMLKENITVTKIQEQGAKVYAAIDGQFAGVVVINDKIKPNAKDVLKSLKQLGIKKTVMLTGDNNAYAQAAAQEIGIDEYYAELLPAQKMQHLQQLQKFGKAFFVGDGINDAPVLNAASVGISMGEVGSDAAVEASDIVIVNDNLQKIPSAIKIARRAISIVKQNIVLAIGVKVAVMVLSLFGLVGMQTAVFADVGVMVIAVINSLRNFIKVK